MLRVSARAETSLDTSPAVVVSSVLSVAATELATPTALSASPSSRPRSTLSIRLMSSAGLSVTVCTVSSAWQYAAAPKESRTVPVALQEPAGGASQTRDALNDEEPSAFVVESEAFVYENEYSRGRSSTSSVHCTAVS
eukprot:3054737-Prymnesium_polylepis.1